MVWTGDANYRLAPALLTLLHQLEQAYPGTGWLGSPQTGTIGDTNHLAEGWTNSDHNPWLANTVRALDVAANVSGVPGIVTVTDAPDCEALFAMVNRMYAAKDPRVWPNGYGIFWGQETDWDNPGGVHSYTGDDQHHFHVHISVSQNPAGFNSTAPWPLPGEATSSGPAVPVIDAQQPVEAGMYEVLKDAQTGAYRLGALGRWDALEGANDAETQANVQIALSGPLCAVKQPRVVSHDGMVRWRAIYLGQQG